MTITSGKKKYNVPWAVVFPAKVSKVAEKMMTNTDIVKLCSGQTASGFILINKTWSTSCNKYHAQVFSSIPMMNPVHFIVQSISSWTCGGGDTTCICVWRSLVGEHCKLMCQRQWPYRLLELLTAGDVDNTDNTINYNVKLQTNRNRFSF